MRHQQLILSWTNFFIFKYFFLLDFPRKSTCISTQIRKFSRIDENKFFFAGDFLACAKINIDFIIRWRTKKEVKKFYLRKENFFWHLKLIYVMQIDAVIDSLPFHYQCRQCRKKEAINLLTTNFFFSSLFLFK